MLRAAAKTNCHRSLGFGLRGLEQIRARVAARHLTENEWLALSWLNEEQHTYNGRAHITIITAARTTLYAQPLPRGPPPRQSTSDMCWREKQIGGLV